MPTKPQQDSGRRDGGQYVLIDPPRPPTVEREAFVQGLFQELNDQTQKYVSLSAQVSKLHAQLMIVERNLRLTREHLDSVLRRTDEAVPADWEQSLRNVRFVGTRLGDACVQILREHGSLTLDQILGELNHGQFRFRSGAPLREINAAMLRLADITREDDRWVYKPRGITVEVETGAA